jgi:tetratricopeptide (TPR) repeat protein
METVRHALALVVLCLATALTARAEGRDAAAIAAYRAGDVAGAHAGWLAALEAEPRPEGAERARILANLGNASFRAGRVLESVGWYTASLRLRPRDADTWANLEHARRVAQLDPADRGDLRATFARLVTALTPAESRLLALLGLVLCAAGLVYEALRGGRAGRWCALGGAASALICAAPALHGAWTAGTDPALIVADVAAEVRSEPSASAAVIARAAAGSTAEVVDTLPGWSKLRLDDGTQGWVPAAAAFRLDR